MREGAHSDQVMLTTARSPTGESSSTITVPNTAIRMHALPTACGSVPERSLTAMMSAVC